MSTDFEVENILKQVLRLVENEPNHADHKFLENLAQELKEYLQKKTTCGICTRSCGNEHYPVKELKIE